ncbi:MAG: Uma2 family endonuclease [Acidobacteriota bacterium]|jgi:Uma2 family endonuclease|nr:Uma2 family endonuclease [Acidobacteriota bacterium]
MNILTKTEIPKRFQGFDGEIYYPESDGEPMAETDIHANLLIYLRTSLEIFFAEREDVYVSGNIMFYYVEGDPTEVISPDVLVCFGIPKGMRTSYKTWEENDVFPSVIIEIASKGTWKKDRIEKRELYEMFGVKEYYIFNPLFPKKMPEFTVFHLNETGILERVPIENNHIRSKILGLDLVVTDKTLRLYNPKKEEYLKSTEEISAENDRLKAELERLKLLLEEKG